MATATRRSTPAAKQTRKERLRLKKDTYTLYIDPDVSKQLKDLAGGTRIPTQEFLREAVDDLLAKYANTLKRMYKVKTKAKVST